VRGCGVDDFGDGGDDFGDDGGGFDKPRSSLRSGGRVAGVGFIAAEFRTVAARLGALNARSVNHTRLGSRSMCCCTLLLLKRCMAAA
jgi:hypothetical protein